MLLVTEGRVILLIKLQRTWLIVFWVEVEVVSDEHGYLAGKFPTKRGGSSLVSPCCV